MDGLEPSKLLIKINANVELINSFSAYTIEISNAENQWSVIRRYRQLRSLHRELEHICKEKLPPFPPKKYFGNTKPTFIAARRIALEKYLQEVALRYDTSQSHLLRTFLDPKEKPAAISLKGAQKAGALGYKSGNGKWKSSWVILYSDMLYIFANKHSLEPEDSLSVLDCTFKLGAKKQSTFEIIPKKEETCFFKAATVEEANAWLSILYKVSKKIKEEKPQEKVEEKTVDKPVENEKPSETLKPQESNNGKTDKEITLYSDPRSLRSSVSSVARIASMAVGKNINTLSFMADPSHKKRTMIVKELLTTEESYVKSLSVLIRLFLLPLREMAANSNPIVTPATTKLIFSEIEVIYNINCLLLEDLKARMAVWAPDAQISDVFLQIIDFLKTYQAYVNNFNSALEALNREVETNSNFVFFLKKAYQNPECGTMTIQSFLIMPVQRIPRYVMLFDDLVSKTPETHSEYKKLSETLEKLKSLATKLNEAKREAENLTQVMNVQMRLVGKFENLLQPFRRFLTEIDVVEVGVLKGNPARKLILFNDMVVVSKMKKTKEHYRYRIGLDIVTSVTEQTEVGTNAPQIQIGVDNGQKWLWTCLNETNQKEFISVCKQALTTYHENANALQSQRRNTNA